MKGKNKPRCAVSGRILKDGHAVDIDHAKTWVEKQGYKVIDINTFMKKISILVVLILSVFINTKSVYSLSPTLEIPYSINNIVLVCVILIIVVNMYLVAFYYNKEILQILCGLLFVIVGMGMVKNFSLVFVLVVIFVGLLMFFYSGEKR